MYFHVSQLKLFLTSTLFLLINASQLYKFHRRTLSQPVDSAAGVVHQPSSSLSGPIQQRWCIHNLQPQQLSNGPFLDDLPEPEGVACVHCSQETRRRTAEQFFCESGGSTQVFYFCHHCGTIFEPSKHVKIAALQAEWGPDIKKPLTGTVTPKHLNGTHRHRYSLFRSMWILG